MPWKIVLAERYHAAGKSKALRPCALIAAAAGDLSFVILAGFKECTSRARAVAHNTIAIALWLKKSRARKTQFREQFQCRIRGPALSSKIFHFCFSEIYAFLPPSRFEQGAYASSRTLRRECGGREWQRWTNVAPADGEVVWSWRSDAGAKS
jgi:hypothetical protein